MILTNFHKFQPFPLRECLQHERLPYKVSHHAHAPNCKPHRTLHHKMQINLVRALAVLLLIHYLPKFCITFPYLPTVTNDKVIFFYLFVIIVISVKTKDKFVFNCITKAIIIFVRYIILRD